MKSESIKELASALSKAQGAFEHAKKEEVNTFFQGKKYASLASVIDAAKKPLSENGLSVVQVVDAVDGEGMYLETILMHTSGEYISGRYPLKPVKLDPQGYGSAITYARRYAFSAITGIAPDDDDDGNAATGNKQPENKPVNLNTTRQPNYAALIEAAQDIAALNTVYINIPEALKKDYRQQANAKKETLKLKAAA